MTSNAQLIQESLSTKNSLKEVRKEKGISLEEVAKKLRISKRYLAALEEEDESLISDVYTLGFLRSYATFLGLDAHEICKKLKEKTTAPLPVQMSFPAPLPGKGMPNRMILVSSFCVLLAIIIGWKWLGNFNPPTLNPPTFLEKESTHTEALEIVPAPAEEVIPPKDLPLLAKTAASLLENEFIPQTAPEKEDLIPASNSVILKTSEEVWIEVKDQEGNVILSRLFKPFETYEFNGSTGLLLKTGNAKGTHLVSGEKTFSLNEADGLIQSNIPLDPQKWVE